MKQRSFPLMFFVFVMLISCSHPTKKQIEQQVNFCYVDPLEKIFPETSFFAEDKAHADVARGEHANFQFAIRAPFPLDITEISISDQSGVDSLFRGSSVGFVQFVRVGRTTPTPSRDRLLPVSGFYPDPIIDTTGMDIPGFRTQPVWVTVPVPVSAKPGLYSGRIAIMGNTGSRKFELVRDMEIEVYNPIIEKTSLWVTNWFNIDRLGMMDNGVSVEKYSNQYWDNIRMLAAKMAEYRQNVAIISPLGLCEISKDSGRWEFDFSNFNKMVEIFIEEGVIGRIEGGHLGGRIGKWESPFGLRFPERKDSAWIFSVMPFTHPGVKEFYSKFIPALTGNLKEKGWDSIYIQHIADEPTNDNYKSYVEITGFIKSLAPGIKVIEACHSRNLENMVDVWVPQLNFLNDDFDFYSNRMKAGDEVWFYTCLAPQGNYANRFIELPLIKTRLLHWINFRYNIPGYLHWGFNFWNADPFFDTSGIITESGNVLPGGDAWIVYPGRGKIHSSIRLEAMRDGIVDYELLKMFEKKHPEEARELARQVVYGFELYDTNIRAFREKRRHILQQISE